MKVLVLVVMMVMTVVVTTANPTYDKGTFGCTFDEPQTINIRVLEEWKLAITECDTTKNTYDACADRLGDCIGNLKKMNGEMNEEEWTMMKEQYQDCSDSLKANIRVNQFRDLADIKKSCPSLDILISLGFNTSNFFPLYRCVAKKVDPGEFSDFKKCINGQSTFNPSPGTPDRINLAPVVAAGINLAPVNSAVDGGEFMGRAE